MRLAEHTSRRFALGARDVCLVGETRRAPSRQCRNARFNDHMSTAVHQMSAPHPPTPVPSPDPPPPFHLPRPPRPAPLAPPPPLPPSSSTQDRLSRRDWSDRAKAMDESSATGDVRSTMRSTSNNVFYAATPKPLVNVSPTKGRARDESCGAA